MVAVTNLFPKALTAITNLFRATHGQRLVVPEHLVFREELANTRNPPARDVDLSDLAAAAREEGLTEQQFMAKQKKALKDAEDTKKKEDRKKAADEKARKETERKNELEEVKGALTKSFNLPAQQKAFKAFASKAKTKGNTQDLISTNAKQHEQGTENQFQKQPSRQYQPGGNHIYETMPGDGSSPNPLPPHNRQNEGAAANTPVVHEMIHAHQQQRGHGESGGYPPPTYQPPTDQEHHRGTGQTHDPRYLPQQGNTRPEGIQQPQPQQRDMRRVNSHNQMAPQNTGDLNYVNTGGPDYDNWEVVDQYRRSQRNDQSNQPLQGNQQQGNPVNPQQPGAQQYLYQQSPSGQEFGSNTNHPPPNIQGQGTQSHHDTPSVHHQNAIVNVPQLPQEYNASVGSSNLYNLAVGSTVQVASVNPNDPQHYGVVRWIGRVVGVDGLVAGIEMVGINIIITRYSNNYILLTGGLHGRVY